MKKVIDRGKNSKKLSEVKPVKNVRKNMQSFLQEFSEFSVQKEVLSAYKLQDHLQNLLSGKFDSFNNIRKKTTNIRKAKF